LREDLNAFGEVVPPLCWVTAFLFFSLVVLHFLASWIPDLIHSWVPESFSPEQAATGVRYKQQHLYASHAVAPVSFMLADAEQEIVARCMSTEQKTTAIQAVLTNHQDNVAAVKAANVSAGLEAIVIEAMNTALKDDLAVIFAFKPALRRSG
jgi:hypothetical protein